jgi:hypothetical protein
MRRLALIVLGLASPALLAAGWLGAGAGLFYALLAVVFPVALAALAAPAGRPAPRLGVVLAVLLLLLGGSAVALFAAHGAPAPGIGSDLPLGLVLALGGLWLLPLVVVGLGYGWSFSEHGPSAAELDRVRAAGAARDETRR